LVLESTANAAKINQKSAAGNYEGIAENKKPGECRAVL